MLELQLELELGLTAIVDLASKCEHDRSIAYSTPRTSQVRAPLLYYYQHRTMPPIYSMHTALPIKGPYTSAESGINTNPITINSTVPEQLPTMAGWA